MRLQLKKKSFNLIKLAILLEKVHLNQVRNQIQTSLIKNNLISLKKIKQKKIWRVNQSIKRRQKLHLKRPNLIKNIRKNLIPKSLIRIRMMINPKRTKNLKKIKIKNSHNNTKIKIQIKKSNLVTTEKAAIAARKAAKKVAAQKAEKVAQENPLSTQTYNKFRSLNKNSKLQLILKTQRLNKK